MAATQYGGDGVRCAVEFRPFVQFHPILKYASAELKVYNHRVLIFAFVSGKMAAIHHASFRENVAKFKADTYHY